MSDERLAMTRYYAMQAVRWVALGVAMIGILMLGDRIDAPEALAYCLFFAGLTGFFFLPRKLARRWRSDAE